MAESIHCRGCLKGLYYLFYPPLVSQFEKSPDAGGRNLDKSRLHQKPGETAHKTDS